MSNQTLAAIIRRISGLGSEIYLAAEDIDESLEDQEREVFEPISAGLLSAAGEIESSLNTFKTTFGEIPINGEFVTTGYGVWRKLSDTDAICRVRKVIQSDTFTPDTVVFTNKQHENTINNHTSD
ncbi:hypothetical protein [Nostoc sp. FACHB-110]|uniref:hypothetical protein n=1 Tax=Nostoc sp. FACHB-110 TaxID=2692834 RepID=UPI001688070F|nr:hypothetical protein [Nostoc sp. FACHB-110]MBD2437387.1 hypothetical protein [Nostoc sp. FACHB-110]